MIGLFIILIVAVLLRIIVEVLVPTLAVLAGWIWFFDLILIASAVFCLLGFIAKAYKDFK